MSRPEQTIAYRVYWQGKDLLGTAQIEMPQVQYMTETLSGSGPCRGNRIPDHRGSRSP